MSATLQFTHAAAIPYSSGHPGKYDEDVYGCFDDVNPGEEELGLPAVDKPSPVMLAEFPPATVQAWGLRGTSPSLVAVYGWNHEALPRPTWEVAVYSITSDDPSYYFAHQAATYNDVARAAASIPADVTPAWLLARGFTNQML